MKISVVTICYNSEKNIEETIKSVLNQSYTDIEYLIQDGKSSDNTTDIIEKYLSDERISYVSEPDKGIYNAMNKALDRATGDYIIFMNSGDIFASSEVIQTVVEYINELNGNRPGLVFGNVKRVMPDGDIVETYYGRLALLKLLLIGRMPSHQTIFVRLDEMKKYRFDENYKICADYDFFVRAYVNRKSLGINYIDELIATVENIDGVSSLAQNISKMRAEDDRSLKQNMFVWYMIICIPKKIYRKLKHD